MVVFQMNERDGSKQWFVVQQVSRIVAPARV